MKRSSVIAILGLIALGVAYLAGCSSPLDNGRTSPNDTPSRIDTVYIFDTLTPSDTALRVDTVRITDTVRLVDSGRVFDTIIRYDTVKIVDHRTDTVVVIDSNTTVDTIFLLDTVSQSDTVTLYDTVTRVDTAACKPEPFCARISSSQKEIVWMFRNDAGSYRLAFSGSTEKNQPLQTLVVNIDGTAYTWQAGDNPVWITELTLGENTTIRISPENPAAFGHEIDICLSITPL